MSVDFGRGTTHVAFADEAYRDNNRFRSVACVSMPVDFYESNCLVILNSRNSTSELKWSKIKGDSKVKEAEQIFACVTQLALKRKLRVDVLIWDMHDSRHSNVKRRDDIQNQQNMFRMLFRDVFTKRWGHKINCWDLSVDIQGLRYPESLRHDLDVFSDISVGVREAVSSEAPMIQIADVFAGLGAFSRMKSHSFHPWKTRKSGQQTLLGFDHILPEDPKSKVVECRFQLLESVDDLLHKHDMPVILDPNQGLRTKNPNSKNCYINFWQYTPQGAYDKAPAR